MTDMKATADTGFTLYLEVGAQDGWCSVHCPDLPGVGYKTPAKEVALALAPARLAAEVDWAARHGVPAVARPLGPGGGQGPGQEPEPGAGLPFTVGGEVTLDVPVATGDTEATFAPELEPLDDAYLTFCLGYLRASRRALMAMVAAVPASFLAWRPAPGKRSVGEILGHVSDGEAFYAVRLEPPEKATARLWADYAGCDLGLDPAGRLERTRDMVLARVDSLGDEDRARVARHDPHAEVWTARKVLRRMIWHERYHARQIEAFLTL